MRLELIQVSGHPTSTEDEAELAPQRANTALLVPPISEAYARGMSENVHMSTATWCSRSRRPILWLTAAGLAVIASGCGRIRGDETDGPCVPVEELPYDGIDQDCDGQDLIDVDGDEWAAVVAGGNDCDDNDPTVNPSIVEFCNGKDDDCDGLVDADDDSVIDGFALHPDQDRDGFGSDTSVISTCAPVRGLLEDGSDCDDGDAAINPDAPELCNDVDDDCDGRGDAADDDLVDGFTVYSDSDGDGFGDMDSERVVCTVPIGWSEDGGDCDDHDATINPSAADVCDDGVDNDCDGLGTSCSAGGSLIEADAVFRGVGFRARIGEQMVPAVGDLNGDGMDDLTVFSRSGDNGDGTEGAVYVFETPILGAYTVDQADATIFSYTPYSCSASAIDPLGDINGDGFDDLAFGLWDWSVDSALNDSVRILHGPLNGVIDILEPDQTIDGLVALVRIGDMNGDGTADLVGTDENGLHMLIPDLPEGDGLATVLATAFVTVNPTSHGIHARGNPYVFQTAPTSGACDLDGDGVDELLVTGIWHWAVEHPRHSHWTNWFDSSQIDVHEGPIIGALTSADAQARIDGRYVDVHDGYLVDARCGDVDADGYDDVLTDYGDYDEGETLLFPGSLEGSLYPEDAHARIEYMGGGAKLVGDQDGDGMPDLMAGNYAASTGIDTRNGEAYLYLGPVSGTLDAGDADLLWYGANADDYAGIALEPVGDVNGDGWTDVLVGAYKNSDLAEEAGAAYLLMGGGW